MLAEVLLQRAKHVSVVTRLLSFGGKVERGREALDRRERRLPSVERPIGVLLPSLVLERLKLRGDYIAYRLPDACTDSDAFDNFNWPEDSCRHDAAEPSPRSCE